MIRMLIIVLLLFPSLSAVSQSSVPDWAKGIVWYQIFPERFRNGDPDNDPEAFKVFAREDSLIKNWAITDWTGNWFSPSQWESDLGGSIRDHLYQRRYGGDIQGIIDKLDYLKELGIGGIYLNPVFEAASLHKYDGSTFHHIDVNFGPDPDGDRKLIASEIPHDPGTWIWTSADKLFLELIRQSHARGMKIIIDGVFNHTGVGFWAFQDILEKGDSSPYRDWYIIESFDDPATPESEFVYKGWWNIPSLPELNRTELDLYPQPKDYIFHSTMRWMDPDGNGDPSDGIDGWRLDVAREVPMGFWKDWSRHVKSINNNALIVGELWELSPDFISQDGPFDALMNYNFAYAVKKLFIDRKDQISLSRFFEDLDQIDKTYPEDNIHALQNLMTSHDTERLSSMIKNPYRGYDRDADERNPSYDPSKPGNEDLEIQKLIAAFQMTYTGAPMIYYGDETGMWGADDPHCRKPMIWEDLIYDDEQIDESSGFGTGFGNYSVEANVSLLKFYTGLIAIRNSNPELRKGNMKVLLIDDVNKVFAFERILENSRCVIIFNLGNSDFEIDIPVSVEPFTVQNLTDKINRFSCTPEVDKSGITVLASPQSFNIYKIF